MGIVSYIFINFYLKLWNKLLYNISNKKGEDVFFVVLVFGLDIIESIVLNLGLLDCLRVYEFELKYLIR